MPAFNEEQALTAFHARLAGTLRCLVDSWEIIYIDDGSSDSTPALLRQLQQGEPGVGVARFSRHFGKEIAVTAGLRLARGAAVVIIDADLQHPPEEIAAMLRAMAAGADVVSMRRRGRAGENALKRFCAKWFYRALNRMSEIPIRDGIGDFRLLSRRAVDAVNQLDERCRFMKGLFAWIGYHETILSYDVGPRVGGLTKWRYRQLWHFALEGLTSFSVVPLKLASYAGPASALGAFVYAVGFAAATLLFGEPVKGFPTLIISILLLGGLQLMATGILGEYIGRLFIETKRRPLYLLETYRPATLQGADLPLPGVVLFMLLMRLATLGAYPLTDATEARYAEIARKMVELNDWLTPWYDYGVPFWAKPPLSTWATALSMKLFGINEFGARLPHFLAGLLVMWLVADWLRRRAPRQALLASALLAGSFLFFVAAGAVMTDMTMAVGIAMAMRGFWLGLHGTAAERRREQWLFFCGLAVGLLAKGPVALVLCGVPIALWAIFTGNIGTSRAGLPWLSGTLLVAVLVLPWYILAEQRTPGFLNYFLVGEHWQRFTVAG